MRPTTHEMAKIKHTNITIKRKIEAEKERCEFNIMMLYIYRQFGRTRGQ
jgi:hypothetical protein